MSDFSAHVLVVDDDTRLRDLLKQFLLDRGYSVSTAVDAKDARAKLNLLAVDIVVLDVMMPGETGTDLLRSLRKSTDVPVLMLTARGEPADRIGGLEAGADDYLPKPFEPRELILRLEAILRRRPKVQASTEVKLGPWRFNPGRDDLVNGDEIIRLSTVEAGLLRSLAAQPGQALTREQLAEASPLVMHPRTIDVQVTRLRRKIEAEPKQPRYLITVRGEGYMLRPDP